MATAKNVIIGKLNESVVGHVEEILSTGSLIISINEKLLRVVNTSSRRFVVGDRLHLIVIAENPIEFSLDPKYYSKHFERIV